MNKTKQWAVAVLLGMALAAEMKADDWDYPYLVMTETGGEQHSVGVTALTLTFGEDQLVAENGNETVAVPLASLSEIHFSETAVVASIENLDNGPSDPNDAALHQRTDVAVYDLTGRRITLSQNTPTTAHASTTATLQPGLYIINGKKVCVR